MYGGFVRRAREARGLSQRELAEVASMAQPNLSAIETDRRMPTVATLHRLLAACGFELLAAAGELVVPLPAPDEPEVDSVADAFAGELTMETRVKMLTGALEAAEAIVRSR